MQSSEELVTRDRAWMRHIYIKKTDYTKFVDLCKGIPRDKIISMVTLSDDKEIICVHAKLKEDEILLIRLSMEVVAVKRPKRHSRISKAR